MKIRFLSMKLIFSVVAVAAFAIFGQPTVKAQITVVQTPQNRNQTQGQQGLPPEQKRSLSRFGPEDVFPNANEQGQSRRRNTGSRQRSQRTSASRPAPTIKQSAAPAVTPVATPSPSPTQATAAKPSPTMVSALANQVQPLPPAQQSSSTQLASTWTVPVLSVLALIVSVALIYVLVKLKEKIQEGSV